MWRRISTPPTGTSGACVRVCMWCVRWVGVGMRRTSAVDTIRNGTAYPLTLTHTTHTLTHSLIHPHTLSLSLTHTHTLTHFPSHQVDAPAAACLLPPRGPRQPGALLLVAQTKRGREGGERGGACVGDGWEERGRRSEQELL
jgi:hypothetical protein